MATNGSRDVKLSLSIETLGEEGIKDLRDALAQLSKQGGDAAPEFQRLANEIDRLGDQAGALRSFQSLAETVRELGQTQAVAADKAAEFKAKLDAASASVQKAASEQAALKTRFQEANAALEQTKGELTILRNSYDENGKRVANYKVRLEELTREKVAQSAVVTNLRDEMRESNAAVREAEAAEKKAQTAYNGSDKALQSLNKTLEARRAELAQQQKAVSDMGLATDDLAQSQASLIAAINGTGAAAQRLKTELDAARAAEKALADQNARAVADNAERIRAINDEIKYRQQLAAQREAAARQAASAEAAAASEAVAAQRRTQAEEQAAFNANIARLNAEIKYRQQLAAQREAVTRDAIRREVEVEKQGAKEREAAARAASDAIANAFKTTGAKSAADLRQQIESVRGAMRLLETQAGLTGDELRVAMGAGNQQIRELERELRAATNQMTLADRAADLFSNSMGQIAAGNLIADAIGSLVEKVKDLGREFIATTVQTEQLRKGLNAIYKDAGIAASQFEFLRKTANENGIAIGSVSESFVRFSAATKSANIPIADTNALFAAVTRAAGSLGLSAEATGGALDALAQIASKGVVSLEELRQQLGDRLPGALAVAAKGLGLTDAELIKLVESGNLASRDFFPAFTKGLQSLAGETEGLIPLWNRFKNVLTTATQNIGDAGGLNVLTGALKTLVAVVGTAGVAITGFVEYVGLYAKSIALVFVPTLSWAEKLEILKEELSAAAARQSTFNDALAKTLNPTRQAAQETEQLSQATERAKSAALEAGVSWEGLSRSEQAAAIAAQIASDSQRTLGAQVVSTNAAVLAFLDTQEKETIALSKVAKAAKESGDTLIALAKLQGDEKGILDASAKAAEAYAAAQEKVSQSRAEETRLLEIQLSTLIRVRTAEVEQGKLSQDQMEKETAALKTKIEASRAEEEQSRSSTEAARQEVEARKLAVQLYGDQSEKLREYEASVILLQETLRRYEELNAKGKATEDEVKSVREALAKATAKYNDTIADTIQKKRLEAQEETIGLQVKISSRNAEVALYQAKAESARASGDLRMATYYETEAKRAKIEADKISVQIKEIEIKLERAELQLKLEQLKLADPSNALKIKELELRIKLTDIKAKELVASRELISLQELAIGVGQRTNNVVSGEGAARIGVTGAIGSQSDAMALLMTRYTASFNYSERQIELLSQEIDKRAALLDLKEKEEALERRRKNVDKDGFTLDNNGNRLTQNVITPESAFNDAKSMGLDDRTALEISDYYRNMAANDPRRMDISAFNQRVNEAKVDAARRTTGVGGVGRNTQAANSTLSAGSAVGTGGAAKTYNVQIGGTTIKTSSDADAQALIGILKKASLTQ